MATTTKKRPWEDLTDTEVLGDIASESGQNKRAMLGDILKPRNKIAQSPQNAQRSHGLAGWYELNPQARQGESYNNERKRLKLEAQRAGELADADHRVELAKREAELSKYAPTVKTVIPKGTSAPGGKEQPGLMKLAWDAIKHLSTQLGQAPPIVKQPKGKPTDGPWGDPLKDLPMVQTPTIPPAPDLANLTAKDEFKPIDTTKYPPVPGMPERTGGSSNLNFKPVGLLPKSSNQEVQTTQYMLYKSRGYTTRQAAQLAGLPIDDSPTGLGNSGLSTLYKTLNRF